MKRMRLALFALFGAASLVVGVSGCGEEPKPVTNPNPGSKRDEIQKKTQSGIPGKAAPSAR